MAPQWCSLPITGMVFDFPVLVNSLAKHSLLQRLEDLGVLFLDSLKVVASLN